MKIKVLLFGILADEANSSVIEFENIQDTDALLQKLKDRFPSVGNFRFATAVNKKIISRNTPVNENDEIALLPPFAGG